MPLFRVSYHSALYAVAWGMHRRGEITDSDFEAVKNAIADQPKAGSNDPNADDNCLCPQLEQLSYDTGVGNGVINDTQPLEAINWANLLDFIKALMPIILQFIAILNPPKPVPVPPKP